MIFFSFLGSLHFQTPEKTTNHTELWRPARPGEDGHSAGPGQQHRAAPARGLGQREAPIWRRIQKTGSPKWVARSVGGHMETKTCGINPSWLILSHTHVFFVVFSPTAESFGVSAQIAPGSARVPGFHEVLRRLRDGASTKKSTACCWGYHLSLVFWVLFSHHPLASGLESFFFPFFRLLKNWFRKTHFFKDTRLLN